MTWSQAGKAGDAFWTRNSSSEVENSGAQDPTEAA